MGLRTGDVGTISATKYAQYMTNEAELVAGADVRGEVLMNANDAEVPLETVSQSSMTEMVKPGEYTGSTNTLWL